MNNSIQIRQSFFETNKEFDQLVELQNEVYKDRGITFSRDMAMPFHSTHLMATRWWRTMYVLQKRCVLRTELLTVFSVWQQ